MSSSKTIEIVRTIADLRARIGAWRADGLNIGLVPTMGALHEGHLTLVRASLATCMRTCVTLFVNPRQFNPNEDLASYPRDEGSDAALLGAEGAHLLFAPEVGEMYPAGAVTRVSVPGIGDILEGAFRPGFFDGVATVVTKLLLQSLPDVGFFGEKDYQQLQVIRRLVADLDIPVKVVGVPTVREADGLAMSSRNAYLTPEERAVAPTLHRTLLAVAKAVKGGADPVEQGAWGRRELATVGFGPVDYVEVRDAETLLAVTDPARPARVLAAARLGRARLIDNVAV